MKYIFPKGFKDSFVATTKEILADDFNLGIWSFSNTCDICEERAEKYFVFKACGSGSMDSWICPNCVDKIKKALEEL